MDLTSAREDAPESTRQQHGLRADWSDEPDDAALRRLHSEQCHCRSGGIIPCGPPASSRGPRDVGGGARRR